MANAKQINELNEATSVSATTKVAVAQPNGTEAEAATVSTLAAGVGEVLNTGAFAELTYATSQGKNAIATALTNKGVDTTANETLIAMADKISALNVDSATTDIKGYLAESFLLDNTSFRGGLSFSKAAMIPCKNGENIWLIDNYLYLLPIDYKYSTLADIPLSAVASIEIPNLSTITDIRNYGIGISSDCTKIVCYKNFSSTAEFTTFQVDWETRSIILINTFETTNKLSNVVCSISNDGTLIACIGYSGSLKLYDTTTQMEYNEFVSLNFNYPTLVHIDKERGVIVYQGGNYQGYATFSINDEGVVEKTGENSQLKWTDVKPAEFPEDSSLTATMSYVPETGHILFTTTNSIAKNREFWPQKPEYEYLYPRISQYFVFYDVSTKQINSIILPRCGTRGSFGYYDRTPSLRNLRFKQNSDGKYESLGTFFEQNPIIYDPTEKIFYLKFPELFLGMVSKYAGYSTNVEYVGASTFVGKTQNGETIDWWNPTTNTAYNRDVAYIAQDTYFSLIKTRSNLQNIGKILTNPNAKILLYAATYSPDIVATGVYDPNSEIIPELPAEE